MHDALVTHEQFDAAQAMFAARSAAPRGNQIEGRHYLLAGLMHCGVCGRRMQGQWNHGRAYYRCKFPSDYPDGDLEHPKSIYVKEDAVVPGLDGWLATLFDDDHIDDTCDRLAGVSEPEPDTEQHEASTTRSDQRVRPQDRLLPRSCSTTTTTSPSPPSGSPRSIANAVPSKRQLGYQIPGDKLTNEQVKALVTALETSSTCSPTPTRPTRPSSTTSWASRSPTTPTAWSP